MKAVLSSFLVAFASAMTIESSRSLVAQPSNLPEACQQYKSVSANPPCVFPCEGVNYCPPPRSSEGSTSALFITKEDISKPSSPNPSENVVQDPSGLSPVNLDKHPGLQKRGLESDKNIKPEDQSERQTSAETLYLGSLPEPVTRMSQFETQVSALYETAARTKMNVASDLGLYEKEYDSLKSELTRLKAEQLAFETLGETPSSEAVDKLGYTHILLQMIGLNILMRHKGCGDSLKFISSNSDRDSSESQRTKLSNIFEALQEFSEIMTMCYNRRNDPDLEDISFGHKVGFVRHRFDALKIYCHELIAGETPLTRILNEELNAVEFRITDLEESAKRHQTYSRLPSQAMYVYNDIGGGVHYSRKNQKDQASQQHWQQMEEALSIAYVDNPQLTDKLDLNEYKVWRLRLHKVCGDVYSDLLRTSATEGSAKKRIGDLLNEMTHELSRKANSVLAVAIMVSSDGSFKGNASLLDFASLYNILKGDISYFESSFRRISSSLDDIDTKPASLGEVGVKHELSVCKALFQRGMSYIQGSEWSVLPEAQGLRQSAKQISEKIKWIESTVELSDRKDS